MRRARQQQLLLEAPDLVKRGERYCCVNGTTNGSSLFLFTGDRSGQKVVFHRDNGKRRGSLQLNHSSPSLFRPSVDGSLLSLLVKWPSREGEKERELPLCVCPYFCPLFVHSFSARGRERGKPCTSGQGCFVHNSTHKRGREE